jgi:hypothetical protein
MTGKNWKRIVAREFLLLVGIAGVCALVAGGMWMWNEVVEGRLERAREERKEVDGKLKQFNSASESVSKWKPPVDDPLGILDESDHRRNLYNALTSRGLDIGTYEEYSSKIGDPFRAEVLYDVVTSRGIDLGSKDEYLAKLGLSAVSQSTRPTPSIRTVEAPADTSISIDLKRIEVAIRKAHAAGDTANAKRLAQAYRKVALTPIDYDPFLDSSEIITATLPLDDDSLAAELEMLQGRSLELEASVVGYARQLKTPEEMWRQLMWVLLALLIVAYPLRFFVLGVRWSVRVLREG